MNPEQLAIQCECSVKFSIRVGPAWLLPTVMEIMMMTSTKKKLLCSAVK